MSAHLALCLFARGPAMLLLAGVAKAQYPIRICGPLSLSKWPAPVGKKMSECGLTL
jgi:hypothetical protein